MNYVDFVRHVENTLGWVAPSNLPLWKARSVEAGKLKKKMAENSKLYTFDNLLLAVEYCRRKRQSTTPTGVCWHVEEALKLANASESSTDLEQERQDAVAWELGNKRFGYDAWIARLQRASGAGRSAVLEEWKAAGRGG